jgi:thiol-disulfide isomerase/thioredoxin
MNKKLLIIGAALLFLFQVKKSNAQAIYTQNFELGTIGTMTLINNDNRIPASGVSFVNAAWVVDDESTLNTNKVAFSTSWYSPSGPADDWIITPQLNITNDSMVMRWRAKAIDSDFPDGYNVKISTAGDTIVDFINTGYTTTGENTSWTYRQIYLSAFMDSTIYIGFQNNSNDRFLLSIDDIWVGNLLVNNVTTVSTNLSNLIEGTPAVTLNILNSGGNTINSIDVSVSWGGSLAYTQTITGLNIISGSSQTLNLNTLTTNQGAGQTLGVVVTGVNGTTDSDPSDDTTSRILEVFYPVPNFTLQDSYGNTHDLHQTLASGKAVVLDFFASWCGPCQSSTPALNQLYVDLKGFNDEIEVYGLTVESSDDAAVVNGLGWGATYPKMPYTSMNDIQYYLYATSLGHGFNTGGSIPFFVAICPDTSDPGRSTIIKYDAGYGTGMFENQYKPVLYSCLGYTASVSENKNELEISVYPNPANDKLFVDVLISSTQNLNIVLIDVLGKKVINKIHNINGSEKIELNISKLPKGAYTLVINSDDGLIKTTQVIKQ